MEIGEKTDSQILKGQACFTLNLEGQYDKAIKACITVLQEYEDDTQIWNSIGIAFRETGKSDAALAAFDMAILIDPGNQRARNNRKKIFKIQYDENLLFDDVNYILDRIGRYIENHPGKTTLEQNFTNLLARVGKRFEQFWKERYDEVKKLQEPLQKFLDGGPRDNDYIAGNYKEEKVRCPNTKCRHGKITEVWGVVPMTENCPTCNGNGYLIKRTRIPDTVVRVDVYHHEGKRK